MKSVFIAGTDTEVGKSVVCGCLASFLSERGFEVVTQKWVSTGSSDFPEDLEVHLKFMGGRREDVADLLPLLVPYSFPFPSSPHLAARLAGHGIEIERIKEAYFSLLRLPFDFLLVEGAGGLLVPLTEDVLLVDLVRELEIPVLLVSRNSLGTVNHTLLSIEALRHRGMRILGVIFNEIGEERREIREDNPKIVEKLGGVEVLGVLPFLKEMGELRKAFKPVGERILRRICEVR